MGRTQVHASPESTRFKISNTTGSDYLADVPLLFGGQWVIPINKIVANTGQGMAESRGAYRLAKNGADTIAAGQRLWWDDAAGQVSDTPVADTPSLGFARQAAGNGTTTVDVELNSAVAPMPVIHTIDAAEGTANTADIDTGLGTGMVDAIVQLRSSGGTLRAGGAVALAGGVVTIGHADLAEDDVVTIIPIVDALIV